ncbi:MAG: patatin-like phospholipase family protein [Sphingobacteriales bacterium]
MSALLERLDARTPKKILALDGGGIRGALTLGYLKKIEDILKAKHPDNPDFRMSDYFDLIGGTTTGAIIDSLLAVDKTVDEITALYMDLGDKIFGEKRNWWNPMETMKWLKANYNYKGMMEGLQFALGADTTLGSDKIKTGLCVVAKRADTNSIWPMINHPRGKFYDTEFGQNKNLLLWQVVRASTAAPTYFAPQMIEVAKGQTAAFIDGGLSMANNPALTLLMIATLKGFPFQWPMAEDKLLLVSVGTGHLEFKKHAGEIDEATMLTWAASIPDMMMQDASWQNRLLLQWLSQSPTADTMDMEIGKLDGDYLSGSPLLSYLRYNFAITDKNLNALGFNRTFTEADASSIADMSKASNKNLLYEIGFKASATIKSEHFDKF